MGSVTSIQDWFHVETKWHVHHGYLLDYKSANLGTDWFSASTGQKKDQLQRLMVFDAIALVHLVSAIALTIESLLSQNHEGNLHFAESDFEESLTIFVQQRDH